MQPTVLVVDDEAAILDLLQASLGNEGFRVLTAPSIQNAREVARRETEKIDVFVVDIGLPDGSGLSLVDELRRTTDAGIIVLSGRGSEIDLVVGLGTGADDYVTKPFRMREFAARVSATHRRRSRDRFVNATTASVTGPHPGECHHFGGYELDVSSRSLRNQQGDEVFLTTHEFALLHAFLLRRGRVLTRDQLMEAVKGREWQAYDRAVDGLVSRLRRKLGKDAGGCGFIRTVHGVGYMFVG